MTQFAAFPAVHRGLARLQRLVEADTQLRQRLPSRGRDGLAGHLATLLGVGLACLPGQRPDPLAAEWRGRNLSADDVDRLGHYLLSTVLWLRAGPEALIRTGAFLTEIRRLASIPAASIPAASVPAASVPAASIPTADQGSRATIDKMRPRVR